MPEARFGRYRERIAATPGWAWALALLAVLVLVPHIGYFNEPWIRIFFFIGLFVILGLGLNVVVGFAGLLDLGYVAFFAAGAYTVALLTSPSSQFETGLNFWLVIPLAVAVGAGLGILLGLPVLPLRGDYLAIVTLGFGEIIRILLVNSDKYTEGSQGLSAITTPVPGIQDNLGLGNLDDVTIWYYLVVGAAFVVAFCCARLRDARIGRAWEAIREDEDVAAAMGINTVKYKLMAFAIGAAIGAFGGAFYASFFGFINPQAFTLQVSIDVLALVIIGGMGSTAGVVVGSFLLIGTPRILQLKETANFLDNFEWLRDGFNKALDGLNALSPFDVASLPAASTWGQELADGTRFILFGALLVAIMVLRPAGIFASRRRQLEFENPPEHELPTDDTPVTA